MLTPEQFDRIRRLALELAGIELFDRHREVLDRKIRRPGMNLKAGYEGLIDAVEAGDANAVRQLIGLLTTNFSGFFRHPQHFDLAAEHVLWAVHRRGAARAWSAAAATGEEPYSLAMSLIDVFRRNDPPITILATDIDDDALELARPGIYGEANLSALNSSDRERFFRPVDATYWQVNPAVRALVEFRVLNLTDPAGPLIGPFDVVFCRNVLMYLNAHHRYAVLERIASALSPDGMLILDPTEHLGPAIHLFARGVNGVHLGRPPIGKQSRLAAGGRHRD